MTINHISECHSHRKDEMALDVRRPVLGDSDQVRHKPDHSATETIYTTKILHLERFHTILSRKSGVDPDQLASSEASTLFLKEDLTF